jgi:uncharacterized membrane protein
MIHKYRIFQIVENSQTFKVNLFTIMRRNVFNLVIDEKELSRVAMIQRMYRHTRAVVLSDPLGVHSAEIYENDKFFYIDLAGHLRAMIWAHIAGVADIFSYVETIEGNLLLCSVHTRSNIVQEVVPSLVERSSVNPHVLHHRYRDYIAAIKYAEYELGCFELCQMLTMKFTEFRNKYPYFVDGRTLADVQMEEVLSKPLFLYPYGRSRLSGEEVHRILTRNYPNVVVLSDGIVESDYYRVKDQLPTGPLGLHALSGVFNDKPFDSTKNPAFIKEIGGMAVMDHTNKEINRDLLSTYPGSG